MRITLKKKARSLRQHWHYGGLYRVVQKVAERLLYFLYPYMSAETYLKLKTSIFTGYWANINQPRSFSEKIVHSKLHQSHPLAPIVSDKFRVRDYVTNRVSQKLLNELYWVGKHASEIPFKSLPDRYVIKANHGAGLNIFVQEASPALWSEYIAEAEGWLSMVYSEKTRSYECQYDEIEPLILVESLMRDEVWGTPIDYKFFCFHGRPMLVQVDLDRFGDHRRNMYSVEWALLPFELHYKNGKHIPSPHCLPEMLNVASKLSQEFEFCRVDLYAIHGREIKFGEITLFPGGGFERFFPKIWDFHLGDYWSQSRGR